MHVHNINRRLQRLAGRKRKSLFCFDPQPDGTLRDPVEGTCYTQADLQRQGVKPLFTPANLELV